MEYRDLDPAGLEETYKDNPQYLAELREKSPEGGFFDEGVTIHVFDAGDGHEYLRFDVFDDEPHYHYVHRTVDDTVVNNVVDFDTVAHGDMLAWTLQPAPHEVAGDARARGWRRPRPAPRPRARRPGARRRRSVQPRDTRRGHGSLTGVTP